MAAQSNSSTIAGMQVEFGADFTQLDSAPSQVGAVFAEIQAAAAEAATGISDSLTGAAESFSSISRAAEEAGVGIGDSNQMALASYDELASGAGGSLATIAEEAASAASGVTEFGDAGASSGTGLLEALAEITQSINAFRETFIEMTDVLISSMDSVATNVKDVQYAIEDMSSSTTGSIEDLSAEFGVLGERAQTAGSEIAGAGEHASGGGGGGGGFMGLFNQIGIGIFNIQNMINMGKQLATSLLSPAVSAETVTTALTTLDGSAKKAAQEMANLNAFAAKTPFKTLDIDQAAEQLQGFGIKAGDVIPEITAIGDALGSVGRDTPAELDSVVQIFGKIHTEGKITQMTMNELAVHGINGWQALADATGKSIPQVKELVKKGLIPADTAIQDLTKGIEKNPLYKGGMAKAAATFTGLMSTLQSNFQQVLASFGSPIIKALEGSLNNLGNLFASPSFQTFAGSVGKGIVDVFSSMGSALHGINLGSFASSFGNMGTIFKNLGGTLSTTLGGAFKAVGSILQSINWGNVMTTVGTLANVVGGVLTHAFQILGPILAQVGKWFTNDVLPALNKALPPIGNLINSVMDFVGAALKPLLSALEPLIPPIITIAGNVANLLAPAFKFLAPGVAIVADAVGKLFAPLQALLNLLSGNWKGALNAIGLGFLTVGDKAEQMRIKTEEAHVKMALVTDQKTAEGAAKAIANMEKERKGILEKLKQTHDPAERAELEHQLKMLDTQENAQKQKLKKAEEDKKMQLAKQKELHDAMLEAQKTGLQKMLDGLGHWFTSDLPHAVGGFFSGFGKFWHDRWQNITDAVGNIFSGIKDFFRNALNGGIDIINSWIKNIDSLGFDAGPIHFHPSIPTIPHLAAGGTVPPGGVAVAGDPGPYSEVVFGGTAGATVLSHAQSAGLMAQTQPVIHVHNYISIDGQGYTDLAGQNIVNAIRSSGHPIGQVA